MGLMALNPKNPKNLNRTRTGTQTPRPTQHLENCNPLYEEDDVRDVNPFAREDRVRQARVLNQRSVMMFVILDGNRVSRWKFPSFMVA